MTGALHSWCRLHVDSCTVTQAVPFGELDPSRRTASRPTLWIFLSDPLNWTVAVASWILPTYGSACATCAHPKIANAPIARILMVLVALMLLPPCSSRLHLTSSSS